MQIAVIADIHANVPGLEAVLADIDAAGIEHIYVAGDLVGAGPSPNQVIAILRQRTPADCIIRGNTDYYPVQFHCGQMPAAWVNSQQWNITRWTVDHLSDKSLAYLMELPDQRRLELPGCDPIRLVHGSPRSLSDMVIPSQDMSKLDAVLSELEEPVMVCGHIHRTYVHHRTGKLAVNPGPVTGAVDGDPRASYAILTWTGAEWQARHRRVSYDMETFKDAYARSGLLECGPLGRAILLNIECGLNVSRAFMDYAYSLIGEQNYIDNVIPDDVLARADDTWHWDPARIQPEY